MKRLFDIVASGCGLIILSPLFLALAIWIKLDSKMTDEDLEYVIENFVDIYEKTI